MSNDVSVVDEVLAIIGRRLRIKSVPEIFRTMVAAQPAATKRRRASDEQMDGLAEDLKFRLPEMPSEQIATLCSTQERPTTAQIEALHAVLGMQPGKVLDHPGDPVTIPTNGPAAELAWTTVTDLSDYCEYGWCLVGGQMVHLLAWEHREDSPRVTTDADVVLDVRAKPTAIEDVTSYLLDNGYREDGTSPDGLGHRYRSKSIPETCIDVLLPEGLRDTAKFQTATGATTIQVPGSVQAMQRSLRRAVTVNGGEGTVIRPDVHGAMVLKAAAYADEAGREVADRHLRDFAVLVSLYARHYPQTELRERLDKKDRRRIGNVLGVLQPDNAIWRTVEDGSEAREVIAEAVRDSS